MVSHFPQQKGCHLPPRPPHICPYSPLSCLASNPVLFVCFSLCFMACGSLVPGKNLFPQKDNQRLVSSSGGSLNKPQGKMQSLRAAPSPNPWGFPGPASHSKWRKASSSSPESFISPFWDSVILGYSKAQRADPPRTWV